VIVLSGRFVEADHDVQKKNAIIAWRCSASGIGFCWIAYCARSVLSSTSGPNRRM